MQCNHCGACREFCYTGALVPFGQEYTVEDMFQYLKKDKPFYDATGGGVTIGGGEATCFADFVIPLMEKLHAESISVAIDTCGYVTTEEGRRVLENADFVLFDVKGLDRERHMANTGVDNTVIWETLHWLDSIQKPIIIRLPVIPGYTDDWEEISDIAERLEGISSIKRIDILPCHHFGKVKYEQIGKAYEISEVGKVPQEYLDQIRNLFTDKGFQTQIGG